MSLGTGERLRMEQAVAEMRRAFAAARQQLSGHLPGALNWLAVVTPLLGALELWNLLPSEQMSQANARLGEEADRAERWATTERSQVERGEVGLNAWLVRGEAFTKLAAAVGNTGYSASVFGAIVESLPGTGPELPGVPKLPSLGWLPWVAGAAVVVVLLVVAAPYARAAGVAQ